MEKMDGYILAGGASSRMGTPKPEIVLNGKRLIDIAVGKLTSICGDRIKIVGNASITNPPCQTINDVSDPDSSAIPAGPLFGLRAALEDAQTEWVAVLACDMPFVEPDLLKYLCSIERSGMDAIIPIQKDGIPQPLCAIYKTRSCLSAILSVTTFDRSLQALIRRIRVSYIEPGRLLHFHGSSHFFFNINSPDDIRLAEFLIAEQRVGPVT